MLIFGSRKIKYEKLWDSSLENLDLKQIDYSEPYYFFSPKDFKFQSKYDSGFKINKLFTINSVGIMTMGDGFIISDKKDELKSRLNHFLNFSDTEDL